MKLFNKPPENDITIITRIVDKDLALLIDKKNDEYVAKHKRTAQKLSILKFDQLPKTANIRDYMEGLVLDFQKLIDLCNNHLNGKLQKAKGDDAIVVMREEEKALSIKISETEDKLAVAQAQLDNTAQRHRATIKRWYKILWVLYFLAGFELLANLEVYNMLGGGILASISIALISGIVVFFWAHITIKILRHFGGTYWRRQLLVFSIMALPILSIFFLFSIMRIAYLIALSPEMQGVYSSNPIVPTLINFFAYLIASYLVFEYRPDIADKNTYKKYQNDLKALEALEIERNDFITSKNALEPQLRKQLLDYKNILLLGQQTEQDIKTHMLSCFHEFKSELFVLTNGRCTKLFANDVEKDLAPLHMNYQDINDKIPTI